MSAIQYAKPTLFLDETASSFPFTQAPAASGHTGTAIIQRDDIVQFNSSGTLLRCVTNQTATPTAPAGVAGFATSSELAVIQGTTTTWTPDAYDSLMFGFTQSLLPPQPGYLNIILFSLGGGPTYLELNLTSTTGWITGGSQQATLGSTGGLYLDATTNLFVFDPTQSNKILTIFYKTQGPLQGGVGDTGARVRCYFNAGLAAA